MADLEEPSASSSEQAVSKAAPAETLPPPTRVTDLQELIGMLTAEKTVYFSKSGKLLEKTDTGDRKYDRADVVAIRIRPLRDDEMVACQKLGDVDPPKKGTKPVAPGQPAAVASPFGDDYDFLDPEYQRKLTAGRRLQRAAIIVGGLVELEIPGKDLNDKADFLSKNFPTRLLTFLREEIEAISSGEIKALELASFI